MKPRRYTKKKAGELTPGKYPKFKSSEEMLKYFERLKKAQDKEKEGKG